MSRAILRQMERVSAPNQWNEEEFGGMMRRRNFGLSLAGLLATSALTTPAHAQIAPGLTPPPAFQTVDENGIDLVRQKFVKTLASISIGPGGPGTLAFNWATDNSRQAPIWGYVRTTTALNPGGVGWDTHYSVTVGGLYRDFHKCPQFRHNYAGPRSSLDAHLSGRRIALRLHRCRWFRRYFRCRLHRGLRQQ